MLAAPVLVAGLIISPGEIPHRDAGLIAQTDILVSAMPQQTATRPARKDHKWDGALIGAVVGAGSGVVVGLVTYGRGDGEWPDLSLWLTSTTFYGAVIGGVTGLIIDLIKR